MHEVSKVAASCRKGENMQSSAIEVSAKKSSHMWVQQVGHGLDFVISFFLFKHRSNEFFDSKCFGKSYYILLLSDNVMLFDNCIACLASNGETSFPFQEIFRGKVLCK